MIPQIRISTHPGKILLHEYLEPIGISQKSLSEYLNIPIQRINEIVNGKRGITVSTAWLFSEAFQTTPEFWMNLQTLHDLSKNKPTKTIKPIVSTLTE